LEQRGTRSCTRPPPSCTCGLEKVRVCVLIRCRRGSGNTCVALWLLVALAMQDPDARTGGAVLLEEGVLLLEEEEEG
jgi:hypothetical protein